MCLTRTVGVESRHALVLSLEPKSEDQSQEGEQTMKNLVILSAAAALMLGLTNVASADQICTDKTVNLVLADGTDVGDVALAMWVGP